MAKVESGTEAIEIVRQELWWVGKPEWYDEKAERRGNTWIVTYWEKFPNGDKHHEVHVSAQTGKIGTIK